MSSNFDPRKMQEMEQGITFVAENMPPMWKRMYDNLLLAGFDKDDAKTFMQAYIHGQAGGKLQ